MPITEDEEEDLRDIFEETQEGETDDVKTLYKTLGKVADKAIRILNDKSILSWASYSHSATPVPIFTIGVGAERFSGFHDNTELKGIILDLVK